MHTRFPETFLIAKRSYEAACKRMMKFWAHPGYELDEVKIHAEEQSRYDRAITAYRNAISNLVPRSSCHRCGAIRV